jgi:hypothetical protein
VVDDANVTIAAPTTEPAPESVVAPEPVPTPVPKRTWSMPKSPVTRQQADAFGRTAGRTAAAAAAQLGRMIAGLACWVVRVLGQVGRAIEDVPPAVRLLVVLAVLALLGVVGSIALQGPARLMCAVVVVPVCLTAGGALGHRWYVGHDGGRSQRPGAREVAPSELRRSVEYVDKKLTLVLESLGTEHHQRAVIALVQAKTALEFALGTEGESTGRVDLPITRDDRAARPRIRAGLAAQSALRESNSLAAS